MCGLRGALPRTHPKTLMGAESRGGVWWGWVQELRQGTQGPGLNELREEISCVSALRKQQPAALGSSTIQVSLLGLPAPSSEVDGGPLLGGSGKTQPCS